VVGEMLVDLFADVVGAENASAAVKIVILDCCFTGLATRGGLGPLAGDVLDLTCPCRNLARALTSAEDCASPSHSWSSGAICPCPTK
jgi:hypothetical protein